MCREGGQGSPGRAQAHGSAGRGGSPGRAQAHGMCREGGQPRQSSGQHLGTQQAPLHRREWHAPVSTTPGIVWVPIPHVLLSITCAVLLLHPHVTWWHTMYITFRGTSPPFFSGAASSLLSLASWAAA